MNIETKVHVEIEERLDQMANLDPATEEYKANAEVVYKLIDKAIEMEKLCQEEDANKMKREQMEEEKKDRKIKNWLEGAKIVVPPTIALAAAVIFSVVERTENNVMTPTREFLKRALRLS